jgi:ubiquitin C-terminal hydrolase
MLRFVNNKNDCYFNSVLQSLFNTEAFNTYFSQKRENEKCIIQVFRIINEAKEENRLINPKNIKKIISVIDEESNYLFGNNLQQDAHETIVKILDVLHIITSSYTHFEYQEVDCELKKISYEAWKKNCQTFGYSFISKYFTGQFKNVIKCKNCGCKNITFESFNNINLNISGEDIIDCIKDFIKQEELHEAKCENCDFMSLFKTTTIWYFPLNLVIVLKRFKLSKNNSIRKINNDIKIDNVLNIHSGKDNYIYKISSIIDHHGLRPDSGHYTTRLFKNNECFVANDEKITKCREFDENNSECYIMIYCR